MVGLKALASRFRKPGENSEKSLRRRKGQAEKDLTGGADSWLTDEAFLRAKQRGVPGIPDARCFTLQSVIRGLGQVDGDVAECGVRFGKSTVFMLEANTRPRQFHLFDSFRRPVGALGGGCGWSAGALVLEEGRHCRSRIGVA
jgi:hypothetical protein